MAVSGIINNVRLAGVAAAVPANRVGSDAFISRFGEESMRKFEQMTGVKERRISGSDEVTSDFAFRAAENLRVRGVWCPEDVDAVIFCSQTPDRIIPSTACLLQNRFGIKKDCVAFDINLGCSGFVYGCFVAASLLQISTIKKVLFIGGDCISKMSKPYDQTSVPLFGDGGFATVIVRADSESPIHYRYRTDGGGADFITIVRNGYLQNDCLYMDGMEVFNFTINEVPDLIKETLLAANVVPGDVDYLVLHQANKFVLKQVAMVTGFPMSKVPISMDRYGNTSVTSIPLTLCDMAAKNRELGMKKLLLSGFGVGLSWGAMLLDFDFNICVPLVSEG